MKQIAQIYHNEIGVAFYWKKDNTILSEKIQLVFKETGFYFTLSELDAFVGLIEESCRENTCLDCGMRSQCVKFLLKTPCSQIDLAVNGIELDDIRDLVLGTLFKVKMQDYVNGFGRN